MHPDLFHLGPLTIRTYGLAMAVSFLLSFWLATRRAPREGFDPVMVLDSFLWLFLGAIIGARIVYIFTDIKYFISNPMEILKIWNGGLVFYGGFLGGLVGCFIYYKKKKQSFWRAMDLYAPYSGLGYAIHRTFGCFLGFGCCYGKPTDLPWGVIFPENSPAYAYYRIPVHPTQLYEAINGLIIMGALMIYRRNPHRIGRPSAIFLMIYSILRFIIEFLRGDTYRGFLGTLSTSQWISIPLFILGLVLWFRKKEIVAPLSKEEAREFVNELLKKEEEKKQSSNGESAQ